MSDYIAGTRYFASLREVLSPDHPSEPFHFTESISHLPPAIQKAYARLGTNLHAAGRTFQEAEQDLSKSSGPASGAVERMSNYGTDRQTFSAGYLFDPHSEQPTTQAGRREVIDRMVGY